MVLSTAVIIATKDRPQEVSNLIDELALQTVLPDVIVVSACDRSDIAQSVYAAKNVQVLFGQPGLTAQRNRALSLVQKKYDIIIFFDDDFIPSRFWIERLQMLLATQSDVGCVTGRVLIDGVRAGGLEWSYGKSIVSKADSSKKMVTMNDHKTQDFKFAYGCNMAFRARAIEHLKFDERLILYGWLEDRDFGFRTRTRARTVSTDVVWGVHLGIKRGRLVGLRFGYSQVVNPWYLMKKGSMTPLEAYRNIFIALAANGLGIIFGDSRVVRWGRLKGNMIAIKDIIFNHWAPERIAEL
jgi:glycosyltransferase involved in cell wall biosynthesis